MKDMLTTQKTWMFTVDTDGVYTCDTYEGHSHPYPDPDLIACAKFCAPNGSIEDIVENLGEWEFFTDDAAQQEEIKKTSMNYFVKNAFYKEQIFPDEMWYPKQKPTPYGMHRNVYGAIHIWKIPNTVPEKHDFVMNHHDKHDVDYLCNCLGIDKPWF